MLKNLELERPLVFIDVETTGLIPHYDRIVELSILKINPDGKEEYNSHRVNPGIPIPAEATAIHGITDADVVEEPKFRQYAKSIRDFLEGCDISGFNVIKFDLPFLETEFARADVEFSRRDRYLIDSQVIYHQRDPRNLQAAYRKYCGKEMTNAHKAEEDAKAAAEILDRQIAMYQDLPKDAAGLSALCYKIEENTIDAAGKFIWIENEAVCNFGKHKGSSLRKIATDSPGYLEWISRGDFSHDIKEIAIKALNGEFPESQEPNQSTTKQ
jgi:DNA polymerase-3 subunit epsilon